MNIQFGCGGNILEGWKNHDSDVDITKPLPYPNESAHAILIEHCLEHVSGPDGFRFMKEAHRILVPGGILRICVPDITRPGISADHAADLIVNHGHLMVYTQQNLEHMLWVAGFGTVTVTGRSHADGHWRVIGVEKDDIETLRVEAIK